MTLKEELAADLGEAGELADLYEPVTLEGKATFAMVESVPIQNEFDEFGGPVFSADGEFKFDLVELERLGFDADLDGKKVVYGTDVYDINRVSVRPGWPQVVCRGTLRP